LKEALTSHIKLVLTGFAIFCSSLILFYFFKKIIYKFPKVFISFWLSSNKFAHVGDIIPGAPPIGAFGNIQWLRHIHAF
jgi:hypothetical protein